MLKVTIGSPSVVIANPRTQVDTKVMYVGKRVSTAAIASRMKSVRIPRMLPDPFFILVKGNKPGLLVHPCRWDGKDFYERRGTYGSLKLLNSTGKRLHAEIVTPEELRKRALKFNQVKVVTRESDGQTFHVALLNPYGEPYVAGVYVDENSKLRVLNMEPPAHYNKGNPTCRFINPKDSVKTAAKLLS